MLPKIVQNKFNISFTAGSNVKHNNSLLRVQSSHDSYTIICLKNKSQIGNLSTINTIIFSWGFQNLEPCPAYPAPKESTLNSSRHIQKVARISTLITITMGAIFSIYRSFIAFCRLCKITLNDACFGEIDSNRRVGLRADQIRRAQRPALRLVTSTGF